MQDKTDLEKNARAIVERWYDCLSRMDIEAYKRTLSEDIIINVLGRTPISGRCCGQRQLFEEVLPELMRKLVPGTINLARHHRIMAVDGNIVVGMMEGGGDTLDGARYEQQYCHIFRIENGLIAEIWEFFDTVQVEVRLFGKAIDAGRKPDDPLRF
jgi:ketosteroid isomerase-like protein